MRKSLIPAALTLLLGAAASRPAFAFDNETLRAHISFPFHVLNSTLPPGDYVIKSAQGMDPALFEIWSTDGKTAMFFLTESGEPDPAGSESAHLVFDQVGQDRFLRTIAIPGETRGLVRGESGRADRGPGCQHTADARRLGGLRGEPDQEGLGRPS